MRKAVSGMVITTIVCLVLALIALVIIWWFHGKVFDFFSDVLIEGIKGLIYSILNKIPIISWFV